MTPEFSALLSILGDFSQGNKLHLSFTDTVDWNKVVQLAEQQSVLPMLIYAFKSNGISYPSGVSDAKIRTAQHAVIQNVIRKEGILKILNEFKLEGLTAVLLKGYALAMEYSVPECRISADADILVRPEDEKHAYEILKRNGFAINERALNTHHAECHHPSLGCIELHVALYDEIVEEIWFDKMSANKLITEDYLDVGSSEEEFIILGENDGIIFYTLHLIKHFILSGMSIRMMLDVVLYLKNHKDTVDKQRLWGIMNDLKYDKFLRILIGCCIRHCHFDEASFSDVISSEEITYEVMDTVMDDLESGGWMGKNDKANRASSWHVYNREKALMYHSRIGYALYMAKWIIAKNKNVLFPNRDYYLRRYPYTDKKPYLIPYAWCQRLIHNGAKLVRNGSLKRCVYIGEDRQDVVGENRVDMFKKLGMM